MKKFVSILALGCLFCLLAGCTTIKTYTPQTPPARQAGELSHSQSMMKTWRFRGPAS